LIKFRSDKVEWYAFPGSDDLFSLFKTRELVSSLHSNQRFTQTNSMISHIVLICMMLFWHSLAR